MALNGSGLFNVDSTGQPVVSSTLISASVFNAFTADVATALSNAIYKDGQQTVTANIPMGGYKFTGLAAGSNAGESVRYEQLAGSISQAFSAASIDLGHASDTTLSRVSAGVVAVEGVNILTTATGAALAGSSGQAFSASAPTSEFNVINVNRMRTRSDMFNVTTNTSTAYVLSPSIPLSGLVDGLAFSIQPHVNCGASPTINISGLGNINIVKETRDGTYVNLVADDLRQYHNYNLIYNAVVAKYVLQKVALSSDQGIGYITGDGGEVTQLTNKSTAVTLNKPTGKITTSNAALGANTAAIFAFYNSLLGANDTVSVSVKSGFATNGTYRCWVEEIAAGSCKIVLENRSAGSLSEAIVINYSIIKGSIS